MDKRDATRTQTWLVRFNPQNVHRPRGSALLRKHTNDWNTNHKHFMMILLQNAVKNTRLSFEIVYVMFHLSFSLRHIKCVLHFMKFSSASSRCPVLNSPTHRLLEMVDFPHASAGRRLTKVYMKARCTSSKDNASTSKILTWDNASTLHARIAYDYPP